jgi:hypothetical protein
MFHSGCNGVLTVSVETQKIMKYLQKEPVQFAIEPASVSNENTAKGK